MNKTDRKSFWAVTALCAAHLLLQTAVLLTNGNWVIFALNLALTACVWVFGHRVWRVLFGVWMYLSAALYLVMLADCFDPVAATVWWKAAVFAVCGALCAALGSLMLFLPAARRYGGIRAQKNSRG